MKECRLIIIINKTSEAIYNFYVDPNNTPLWIDSIKEEKTNEKPIKIGTKYINSSQSGEWSEYTVTALEPNRLFELTSEDGNYHVRYTNKAISDNSTELEYYEWVNKGELEQPFTLASLQKMKAVIEAKNNE